ncbi:unnamed protein product [Toxocara canis]|uniref:cAMP-independent regulatory protein pac2 n=1 Tax=Toxocara canis TaxID=6265 RepID=A0A183UTG0_TOXCA|nr:unnamed protein product [Toxocara canis]
MWFEKKFSAKEAEICRISQEAMAGDGKAKKANGAAKCDEKCSQLAKRILSHFGRNCIGKLGPDIAQIQARLNDGDCTVPVSNGHKRLAKRSASASRALDLEVIDGVSGGVQPIISPGIDSSLESGDMLRRSTRSPMSEQIRHWKNQLSGDEISHSGDFSTSISFLSREWSVHEIEEIPERYQISSDNYRPQSALQVNSVKNSERPTAALGPPRSEFDFSEVKKVNVERPASVSLLSKDSRPIQHQASPDRYPPVPNYVTKPLENIQSTIAEKENELQRVRPQLKPPDLTGPIRHSVNGHDLYMPLAARRNNTDNDRLNHRNRSQELLSSTESKYLYPSTSTSPPSGAVRYMPPLRSTTLPSDSLNSAHVPTRETYHSVSHPLVRADLRRTGAIYSTKMPAPNTRSHPTATFADDSKTSSGHLTHSKVQTSESGGQNPHRAQQITSTTSNAKAGDQRIRGTHAVTTSAYSLTQSVENSKMVTLLPDVAESTKRPSMTRGRDRLGTEITMRQGNGRGTTHQRALGILSENSAQRYSSKNGLTTQRPVTSIPQPPVDKQQDTRWDSGHNGVRSGSVNQSEPVRHGHVSELKGNMGIIHSETQFRQKDHSGQEEQHFSQEFLEH